MQRPRVTLSCVADRYHGQHERIVEFIDSRGNGGLISFFERDDGTLSVDVYRQDATVTVRVGKPNVK